MNAFDAHLRRAFAEQDFPVDDGFAVAVSHRVARRERLASAAGIGRQAALGVAAMGLAFGALALIQSSGPELMAAFGLELARAHGALAQADGVQPMTILASLGGALSQFMIAAAAAAGGVAAYRAVQE